jgi:predicted ATPase
LSREAPLIGRANEHSALAAAYRAARQSKPQLVSVEGEPGIGKSRLAREFLAWASAQGGTVLQGRAWRELKLPKTQRRQP